MPSITISAFISALCSPLSINKSFYPSYSCHWDALVFSRPYLDISSLCVQTNPIYILVITLLFSRDSPFVQICTHLTTSIVSLLIVDRASTVKSNPFVPHVHPSSDQVRSIVPFFLSCLLSDNVSRSRP